MLGANTLGRPLDDYEPSELGAGYNVGVGTQVIEVVHKVEDETVVVVDYQSACAHDVSRVVTLIAGANKGHQYGMDVGEFPT